MNEPATDISRVVLPGGIRVVTERMPSALSVCLGVWVGVGSRDEPAPVAGVSHFLEHLLFKGTDRRSARDIARAVDAVGGDLNAFTAREHTAYYARLPAAEMALGLDLLTDVVTAPALRPHEIDSEREVILEELLAAQDAPEDRVHITLDEAMFPGHSLGRETLGDHATIAAMARDDIAGFFDRWYRPANLVVAAAGDLDHDQVVQAVADRFSGRPPGERPVREVPAADPARLRVVCRPTEQVHVAFGWRSLDYHDPDRYALQVLNEVLGGGPSSRLFQEVREERGLAYSVYSAPSAFADAGSLVVYASTIPARIEELLEVVDSVVARLVDGGIDPEEHAVAVGCLTGSLVLGLEDSASRMARLATSETIRGEVLPVSEQIDRLRAVSADDVARVAGRVLGGVRSLSVVGPFEPDDARLVDFAR